MLACRRKSFSSLCARSCMRKKKFRRYVKAKNVILNLSIDAWELTNYSHYIPRLKNIQCKRLAGAKRLLKRGKICGIARDWLKQV